MQINTISYQNILNTVSSLLESNDHVIIGIIDSGYNKFQQDHQILYIDELYDYFFNITKENLKHSIEILSFYSITRRLDSFDDGLSLLDLLTTSNDFSDFLKKYSLTFKYNEEIEMYVNGNKVDMIDDTYENYLKYRFKHDYSFKGFAFEDQLMNNEIIEIVKYGPEFFGHLFNYIDNDDQLIDDYYAQSKLYKYEYLVPIDKIYFENYEELTNREKQYHILAMMMLRLYFYKYNKYFVETDEMNPLMVVADYKSLSSKYLVNKTELDDEALGY
ncbi:hypothetical protein [Thomasclavelia ramosa]|uniref:hypothetical protein n=1 Tax=Thomasclavelia ramosa TaxID=1547 RepID=UPI00191FBFDE|nr:hypothetical protein [Thomasclavelia ramosa]MCR1958131.1 hypothetical protein [Thomasclavelia ramosa]QQV04612.1 hypothetical protein I6I62_09270 [Thomasclavelia ramosa]